MRLLFSEDIKQNSAFEPFQKKWTFWSLTSFKNGHLAGSNSESKFCWVSKRAPSFIFHFLISFRHFFFSSNFFLNKKILFIYFSKEKFLNFLKSFGIFLAQSNLFQNGHFAFKSGWSGHFEGVQFPWINDLKTFIFLWKSCWKNPCIKKSMKIQKEFFVFGIEKMAPYHR